MSKNYLSSILVTIVIVSVAVFLVNKMNKTEDSTDFPDITFSPEPSLSPTPIPTPTPKPSVKPTPTIIFEETMNYEQLTKTLGEKGRWLVLAPDCSTIVPSNVNYYNNTQIMLDNTASKVRHILKIGGREYLLEAGEWFLTTLSSPTLPAPLPIYCGTLELGRIDLIKQ